MKALDQKCNSCDITSTCHPVFCTSLRASSEGAGRNTAPQPETWFLFFVQFYWNTAKLICYCPRPFLHHSNRAWERQSLRERSDMILQLYGGPKICLYNPSVIHFQCDILLFCCLLQKKKCDPCYRVSYSVHNYTT